MEQLGIVVVGNLYPNRNQWHICWGPFSAYFIHIWCFNEYLWQQEGMEVNCSAHVHDNEGTCHQVQLFGSLSGFRIIFGQQLGVYIAKRNMLYQALATQTILDEVIVSFGIFMGFAYHTKNIDHQAQPLEFKRLCEKN